VKKESEEGKSLTEGKNNFIMKKKFGDFLNCEPYVEGHAVKAGGAWLI